MIRKILTQAEKQPSPFKSILPGTISTGKDSLILRLDFYTEAIVMHTFEKKGGNYKLVSAADLTHALARELPFSTGLLPLNTLWWTCRHGKSVVALWVEPGIRRLALQENIDKPPRRFNVPLPGLIFICRPGEAPSVFAATKRPDGPKAQVFKAPLANVYDNGTTCPGTNRYPDYAGDVPDSFFRSFFSEAADVKGRSKKYPNESITRIWEKLDKKKAKEYPLADMVYHGTLNDLMGMCT